MNWSIFFSALCLGIPLSIKMDLTPIASGMFCVGLNLLINVLVENKI